jgi:hypothetical protein
VLMLGFLSTSSFRICTLSPSSFATCKHTRECQSKAERKALSLAIHHLAACTATSKGQPAYDDSTPDGRQPWQQPCMHAWLQPP